MANLSQVVYINEQDYGTLISQGQIVKNGITHTYDESALYIIKDVSFPEYAETAGYAYTANSAASASKDSSGNNIIQTYSKKPLIIEVQDDEQNVSGAYTNILNAIAENREVILKVTIRSNNDEIQYLKLYLDDSEYNDEIYFGNWECQAVISSDNYFYFTYASSGEHNHGNITAAGALQATDVAIASGDKLVVTDASNSNKIARTSLSFDGSTTTQALTKKGTFETFVKPVITSTDNAVVRFDGTSGNIQNSGVTIDDSNNITAVSFKKSGGTSVQFLKADGSVDSNTYATSSDSRFGKVSQTATDSGWADYEILFSGSANNTTATEITRKSSLLKFNPARNKLLIGNPGVIEFSAISSSQYEANNTLNNVIGNSPMPKYTWHDLFAFCRVVPPTYYISNDNSTWTESTLNKNLFNQKQNQSIIILPTSGNTGARWIWNSTSYQYCMGAWLVLGFTWQSTPATVTVVFDTSSDGTTWTERHNSTLTCGQSPVWFYAFSSQDHRYIRLTITKELTDSGACSLSAIKWLTNRWGGQGQGIEYEYPYDWDINGNIMSINAENCNLGATNNYWNNVYAKQFIIKNGTSSQFLIGANDVCKLTENPYVGEYLTFTALSNTTFTFSNNSLQYSTNNGSTWTTLAANTASPTVTTGNKILWKQTGLTPVTDTGIGYFSSTGNFEVSGNIMSLHYGDNFIGQIDLIGKDYAFYNLFYNCTKLISAQNLVLPALTLSRECYTFMFRYCSSLVIVPKILPATKLANNCYSYMFSGCTSLIKAPELPAITLTAGCYQGMFGSCSNLTQVQQSLPAAVANYCYYTMFQYCTSLTTAPELPATTLASNCYYRMFNGCTSLRYVKCLATDISATNCTTEWLNNVSSSGDFIKNNNMTGWTTGVSGIPTTWQTYNNSQDYDARGYHIERLENTIGDINTILDNIIGSNIIGYCWANSDTTHVPFSLGETITYSTSGTTTSFNIQYLGDELFTDETDWVFGESDDIMDQGGAAAEYTGGVITFDGRDAGFDGTFEEGHTVYIFLNQSLLFSINFT